MKYTVYLQQRDREITSLPEEEKAIYDSGDTVMYNGVISAKGHLSRCVKKNCDESECCIPHFNKDELIVCACVLDKENAICPTTFPRKWFSDWRDKKFRACRRLCKNGNSCENDNCALNHISNEHTDACGERCEHVLCFHGFLYGECIFHILFNVFYKKGKRMDVPCKHGKGCHFRESVSIYFLKKDGWFAGTSKYGCGYLHKDDIKK